MFCQQFRVAPKNGGEWIAELVGKRRLPVAQVRASFCGVGICAPARFSDSPAKSLEKRRTRRRSSLGKKSSASEKNRPPFNSQHRPKHPRSKPKCKATSSGHFLFETGTHHRARRMTAKEKDGDHRNARGSHRALVNFAI